MRRSWIKSTADLIPSSLALVQADVRLLVELTLKSLAKVVTADKTKCRPLKHKLVHETLALESLGSAWLEILRRPWLFDGAAAEEPLPIIEDTDDAGHPDAPGRLYQVQACCCLPQLREVHRPRG